MIQSLVQNILRRVSVVSGIPADRLWLWLLGMSLEAAAREKDWDGLMVRLREIEPDIVRGRFEGEELREYWDLKWRMLHAFQCSLALKAVKELPGKELTVVDIGSAGTHLRYLDALTAGERKITGIGVNLDPQAVEQLKAQGYRAVLGRGEELHRHLAGEKVDLFLSFETVEHLHDPAVFFRRLSRYFSCDRMVVSVPYRRHSRVGLFNVREGNLDEVRAGEEHIFELSPGDWELLMLHAGWRVRHAAVFRQYPVRTLLRPLFERLWREAEFEGFWGAILEKDTSFADRYRDWVE